MLRGKQNRIISCAEPLLIVLGFSILSSIFAVISPQARYDSNSLQLPAENDPLSTSPSPTSPSPLTLASNTPSFPTSRILHQRNRPTRRIAQRTNNLKTLGLVGGGAWTEMFEWIESKCLDALAMLGLWRKKAYVLFLGLDNAGKSTMITVLQKGHMTWHSPTIRPYSETLRIGRCDIEAHDLGGHEAARRTWPDYFWNVDAVVFMVDASDPERFPEARRELENVLMGIPPDAPLVILGNKIDHPGNS